MSFKRIISVETVNWNNFYKATLECGHTLTIKSSHQQKAKCYSCAVVEKAIAKSVVDAKKPHAK
jgi:hypothetical protein